MSKKLPIGIQSFEKLRTEDFLYVDKTAYLYQLAHNNVPYFLSRPRRFGKSLFLSTMKAYWEGKKELFSGLNIEKLEEDNPNAWKAYPVFTFDFNGVNYQESGALERSLDFQLQQWEEKYTAGKSSHSLGERFQILLRKARESSGLRSVILVDEYDKPLLDVIEDQPLREHNKEVLKGFFSTLKSSDDEIQFIFITGVSKFHKVSIFSDLNQLNDLSLIRQYAGLCGVTEDEILRDLRDEVTALADEQGITTDECLSKLKQTYDGYHFHPDGPGVYNPYSLFSAFFAGNFGSYWFETGTPTFLIKKLREINFDVHRLTDRTIFAGESVLKDYTGDMTDPVPLLYQTGYLTIVDYDRLRQRYTLSFPNEEVKYGFYESLIPSYAPNANTGNGLDIYSLDQYIENGELDEIRNVFTGLFASITYTQESAPFEHYFQTVIYLVFMLLKKFVRCEIQTYAGRIDCVVETPKYIYLFELKRDESARAALSQIDSNDYALPYIADHRKLYKIGVSFDSKTRKLVDWAVKE